MQRYEKITILKKIVSLHRKKTGNMERITAVIITQNEERNIERCLVSLCGVADEVIVVDSGSTDRTEEICTAHGARFVSHKWEGYAQQKNYGDSLATSEWILSLDADEELTPTLRESILELKNGAFAPGHVYSMDRLNNHCGTWIRHSGWSPDMKVRLWERGIAQWDGAVHEELRYSVAVTVQKIEGKLLHYTYHSIGDHAARQLRYALLAAEKAHERQRRCSAFGLWFRPKWNFIRNYVFKGGFRDGKAGYIVCRMSAYYTFLKYARLRELNDQSRESFR